MAVRRYNPEARPPVTLALVGINVAIALIDMFSGGYIERLFWARGIDVQYGEYWRLFTSGFVHVNLMHIAFNAYGIYLLGTIFERLQGWKAMLFVYFVSLFGGAGLAIAFMDPNIRLLGASGAAYGLFGAVLGFFYAKTGSVKGILQVPMGRQLMIWLLIGVVFSMMPGISFLGHAGGFVPGVILGVYFEHRYQRELDVYHHAAAGLVLAGVIAVTAFAMFPVTRASWYASQALKAYSQEDFSRGDELLKEAKSRNRRDDGTRLLVTHLELWREHYEIGSRGVDMDSLRWPLTHVEPLGYIERKGMVGTSKEAIPYDFITENRFVEVDPDEGDECAPPEPVESDTADE